MISTPELSTTQVLLERNIGFIQNENDVWATHVDLRLRGEEFETIRYLNTHNEGDYLERQLTEIIGIENFEFTKWDFHSYHRDTTSLIIKGHGICDNPVRDIAGIKVINPLQIELPKFEKPEDRKYDVHINFPINKIDKIVYKFHNLNNEEVQIPENYILLSEFGDYKSEYKQLNDNTLEISEKFTLYSGLISLENYESFYRFIKDIESHKKQSAIIAQ